VIEITKRTLTVVGRWDETRSEQAFRGKPAIIALEHAAIAGCLVVQCADYIKS
jgi:hypothetical protein